MAYVLGKKYVDEGIWFEFPGGGRFLIARYESNIEFERIKRELEHEARGKPGAILRDGQLDPEIQLNIASECYARAIIKDWDGVVDESQKAVQYDWRKGKQLILDDERFSDWIADTARNEANFRAGEVDGTAKK